MFFFSGRRRHTSSLCDWSSDVYSSDLLLTQRSGEVAKKAQGLAAEAQGRAGEWLDKSRELFEEQTQRLLNAFEAGKDAMREEIGRASCRGEGGGAGAQEGGTRRDGRRE